MGQALAGAAGRFLGAALVAASVLLSNGAAEPKLAVGRVRSGQGKPTACCGKMAGTKAFPAAAGADCTGK